MVVVPIASKITLSDETVRPVVSAFLDLFSPATELTGWVGDAIRIHRARSVIKCFSRTKAIAQRSGVTLKAPPIKFLSQFIENCSLEDESDSELIEWWARMLVDASSKFESKHIFYSNILKQIAMMELELLEVLARNCPGNYRLAFVTEAQFMSDFGFPGEKIELSDKFGKKRIRDSIRKIHDEFDRPGVLILDVFIDDDDSRQFQEFHDDYTDDELSSWQILQSLQLVRLDYSKFISGSVEYRVRRATMTQLGADFYFSCHANGFENKYSSSVRFKRTKKSSRTASKAE